MTSYSETESNPFDDPAQRSLADDGTLNVGRNASLTLGAESLIVLDEGLVEQPRFNCFGLLPLRSKKTRAIPYFNILWASVSKLEISIQYAKPVSKNDVRVAYMRYILDATQSDTTESAKVWVEKLLEKAYGVAQRQKRIKVLINPAGGKGNAEKYWRRDIEPIFAAGNCAVNVETTRYQGHGVEIGKEIDLDAYDAVACCSGDGLPHEVFNGLGKRDNASEALRRMAVVNLPCGSGNAMSWNLNGTGSPSLAALCIVKGIRMPLDLVSISQGDQRLLSFLSQSVGIVADSDVGSDSLRWMGAFRFTYAFLVRLLGKTTYPCDIAVKVEVEGKPDIQAHYENAISAAKASFDKSADAAPVPTSTAGLPTLEWGTNTSPLPDVSSGWTPLVSDDTLGNFYSGNMCFMSAEAPFFSCSLPCDGFMDLVTIDGMIPRRTAVSSILHVGDNTLFNQPYVNYRKVSAYRIIPKYEKGYISIDGEVLPFGPFQAEVHRGLGCVLSRRGWAYESEGPKDVTGKKKSMDMSRAGRLA